MGKLSCLVCSVFKWGRGQSDDEELNLGEGDFNLEKMNLLSAKQNEIVTSSICMWFWPGVPTSLLPIRL
jgi:hypothetical protein